MNIANQFQKICIFFAHNGFVSILEKMAGPLVSQVEVYGIPGEQFAHEGRKQGPARSQQEMNVIGHEGPGEAIGTGLDKKFRNALQKALSVAVITKDVAPINPTDDNVLQKVENIKAGGSWHAGKIDYVRELVNK